MSHFVNSSLVEALLTKMKKLNYARSVSLLAPLSSSSSVSLSLLIISFLLILPWTTTSSLVSAYVVSPSPMITQRSSSSYLNRRNSNHNNNHNRNIRHSFPLLALQAQTTESGEQVSQLINNLDSILENSGTSAATNPSGGEAVVAAVAESGEQVSQIINNLDSILENSGTSAATNPSGDEAVVAAVAMSIPNSAILIGGGIATLFLAGLGFYLSQSGNDNDDAEDIISDEQHDEFSSVMEGTTSSSALVSSLTREEQFRQLQMEQERREQKQLQTSDDELEQRNVRGW